MTETQWFDIREFPSVYPVFVRSYFLIFTELMQWEIQNAGWKFHDIHAKW